MRRRSLLPAFCGLIAAAAFPAAAHATPPRWEANQGATIVGLTNVDDGDAPSPALGTFSFPFYGVTYTGTDVLTVSSNGFLLLGSHPGQATDNTPTGQELTVSAFPFIAPYWADLITSNLPPDQGDVLYNTFNDDGDPAIDRVVVTWKANSFGCAANAAYPACKNDVQVQLLENGTIITGYDGLDRPKGGGQPALVGAASGGLTSGDDPGSRDISQVASPFTFGKVGYEIFGGNPLQPDVDQRNLVFTPTGTTGFSVDQLGEDVAVTLSGAPTVTAGGTVTYTATVKNNGEAAATGVTLTSGVPSGTQVTGSSAGCAGTSVVTCGLGTLAPGASATAAIVLKANQPGAFTESVVVRPAEAGDPAGDNAASVTTTVTGPAPAADTVPGALPPAPAVTALVRKSKLGTIGVTGIGVSLTCAAACGVEGTATVDRLTAKRLRIPTTLGSGSGGTKKAGRATFAITLSKAVAARVRRQKSLKVKVTFVISTEAGERVKSSTVTLKK